MTLSRWLRDRLGTPARGRGAKATKCLVCKADILAGPDEDQMALPAVVDTTPLSPWGEAAARIQGRRTYRLHRHKEGLALTVRMALNITNHPASDEMIVLADHKCHTPELPSVEIRPAPEKTRGIAYDNDPPF